jgi:hypothetical protein
MRPRELVTPVSRHAAASFPLQTLESAAIGIKDTASPAIGIRIGQNATGDMGGIGAQAFNVALRRARYGVVLAGTESAISP